MGSGGCTKYVAIYHYIDGPVKITILEYIFSGVIKKAKMLLGISFRVGGILIIAASVQYELKLDRRTMSVQSQRFRYNQISARQNAQKVFLPR